MFCPKCATQNLDGASYCRSCGANISLIPQALDGQLPQAQSNQFDFGRRGWKRGRESTMDHAFKNAFMGIAFLLVSIALSFSPMGRGWWFWMLIPAFSMMGSGVAQYVRVKERERQALRGTNLNRSAMPAAPRAEVFAARSTGELMATPPSVTEGTTRHLGAEAPTKHLDASSDASK
ncbi:MAG TPA: zinc ribbon domain-containing protein [Pyrinomonadaceae bacterium]|nr:zinc ribbon domain-containing protein [Pyrinomonadaceae bacterium]